MLSRLRALFSFLGYRVFMAMGSMYVVAASVIGFETLALLLGYATMAPIAVPVMIAGIALWAVIRRRLRRRLHRRLHRRLPRRLNCRLNRADADSDTAPPD